MSQLFNSVLRITIDPTGAVSGGRVFDQAVDKVEQSAKKAARDADKLGESFKDLGDDAKKSAKKVDDLDDELAGVGKTSRATSVIVGKASLAIGALAVALTSAISAAASAKTLIDFETNLVGVGRTADLSGVALDAMADKIIGLSAVTGQSTTELLNIAQAAGQLGVTGSDNILLFTETIAKLGDASDFAGDQAATSLARLLSITRENIDQVGVLASVIVALGNNSAATESEIAAMATRIAQSTIEFGLTSAETVALGAALVEMGISAQVGGTAVGRAFSAMDSALRKGGDSLLALEEITGLTFGQLSRLRAEDPAALFVALAEGLGRASAKGDSTADSLDRMGLSGERIQSVLPTLALNAEVLSEKFGLMNTELVEGNALNEEAAKQLDTVGGQLGRVGSAVVGAVLQVREANGPVADLLSNVADFINVLSGVSSRADTSSQSVLFLVDALKGLTAGAAAFAVTGAGISLTSILISTTISAAAARVAILNLAAGVTTLTGVMLANPVLLFATAIGVATAAIVTYTSATERAIARTDAFITKQQKAEAILTASENAVSKLARARDIGSSALEVKAIDQQVAALQRLSVALRTAETAGERQPGFDFRKTLTALNPELAAELNGPLSTRKQQGFVSNGFGSQKLVTRDVEGFFDSAPQKGIGDAIDAAELEIKRLQELRDKIAEQNNKEPVPQVRVTGGIGNSLTTLFGVDKFLNPPPTRPTGDDSESVLKKETVARQKAQEAIDDYLQSLEQERQILESGNRTDAAVIRARWEAEELAREAGIDVASFADAVEAEVRAMEERKQQLKDEAEARKAAGKAAEDQAKAIQKATQAQQDGFAALDDYLTLLKEQTSAVEVSAEEQEVADARRLAGGLAVSAGLLDQVAANQDLAEAEVRKRQASLKAENAADDAASAITGALTDTIIFGKSARDQLLGVARAFAEIVANNLLLEPAAEGISSLLKPFFASLFQSPTTDTAGAGGGDAEGNIRSPFGIVTLPSVARTSSGITSIGETGEELIAPIERLSNGRPGLQVSVNSGGGGDKETQIIQPVTNTYVTMNVKTPDVAGFGRSQAQLVRQAQSAGRSF